MRRQSGMRRQWELWACGVRGECGVCQCGVRMQREGAMRVEGESGVRERGSAGFLSAASEHGFTSGRKRRDFLILLSVLSIASSH